MQGLGGGYVASNRCRAHSRTAHVPWRKLATQAVTHDINACPMVSVRSLLLALPFAAGLIMGSGRDALATPEVPLDDLSYAQLYRLQDLGRIPVWPLSGTRPLTEAQIQSLLIQAGQPPDRFMLAPDIQGFWVRPLARLTNRLTLAGDQARPFSTPARPREIAGSVDTVCEHQEGRPCGGGLHEVLEVDSSAGYGTWISAFSRLQSRTGTSGSGATGLAVDRLYASLELGNVEFTAGRNVVGIGPGRRTQLIWGDQPPPLDHVSLSVHSLKIPHLPVVLGGTYLVGTLDAPQRFAHSLVTIARGYAEISERLCLGITNLLLLGGDGAPHVSFGQFFEEHVTRTGPWPGVGVSDRRVALDLTLQVRPLKSTFYTEMAFEDTRRQLISALTYDTDYLVGWAASALGRKGRHGFLVELHHTGVRSQEHGLFTSGMTSGGRPVGPPLGPDATSLYVSPRWDSESGVVSISPWAEFIRIGSDVYDFPEDSAISRRSSGLAEIRSRSGLRVLGVLQPGLWLQVDNFVEHVGNEAFQVSKRNNAAASLTVIWREAGGWGSAARTGR